MWRKDLEALLMGIEILMAEEALRAPKLSFSLGAPGEVGRPSEQLPLQ